MTVALRYVFIAIWLLVVSGALYLYFFHRDLVQRGLQDALSVTAIAAAVMYLFLGSIRAFTLIPATFLILAALPFFKPVPLFLLTMAGILISSAGIYRFSEAIHLDELFQRKHKDRVAKMKAILQRHQMPIIIGWSFFPLVPTDLMCYVCGTLKINFKKFLLGVLIGEGTICAIYIVFGDYLKRVLPYGL